MESNRSIPSLQPGDLIYITSPAKSIEKELIEMTEEVYVEVSIAESKKTNLSKIKRPFNGFLHCKTAIAEFVKDTSSESPLQHLPKLHLRNRVFLI